MIARALVALPLLMGALSIGCDAGGGTGNLAIRISGEEAVKRGFPLDHDGHKLEFADGWTMRFDKYLVAAGNIRIREMDRTTAAESDEIVVADLVKGDPVIFTFEELPAQRWPRIQYEVSAPSDGARNLNGVFETDLARMIENGFNYWIEGSATKGGRTVTFAWGLRNPIRNSDCTSGTDGTPGVVVRRNSTVTAEITIHIEHMFWNSLGSEGGTMRFDAIAAMADENGVIDLEALATQALSEPLDEHGEPLVDHNGNPVIYDPAAFPIDNLRDFLLVSASYQAHLNGTGICTTTRL